jgi:hypothetical protein
MKQSKKAVNKKQVPTIMSKSLDRGLLLPDAILQRLSEPCLLLHQFLMAQPEDYVQMVIPFQQYHFSRAGQLIVNVEDLIEMLKQEEANISILKLFCM